MTVTVKLYSKQVNECKRLETNKRRDREASYVAGGRFVTIVTRLPKKTSVYCFVEREKMDDILTEENLQTLAAVFRREIIVPSIVQSMSNEKIE